MNDDLADEELEHPRRRVPTGLLAVLVGAAVLGGVLVAGNTGGDGGRRAAPSPRTTTSTVAPEPDVDMAPVTVDIQTPDALLRAVTAVFPRAELIETGVAVPVRPDSDRNYQFQAGSRRITVVVGRADSRPAVQTRTARDVLVVAKPSGRRVAVSVRNFRGTVRRADFVAAQRLVRDTRLLARA